MAVAAVAPIGQERKEENNHDHGSDDDCSEHGFMFALRHSADKDVRRRGARDRTVPCAVR